MRGTGTTSKALTEWIVVLTSFLLCVMTGCGIPETSDPDLQFTGFKDHARTDAPFKLSYSTQSTAPVSVSIVSGPATISGDVVTLTGETGTVVVQAQQPDAGKFRNAKAQALFNVLTGPPSGSSSSTSNASSLQIQGAWSGPSSITLTAVSPSSSPVTFSLVSGPATLLGSTLSINGSGAVIVNASQMAAVGYAAASATETFKIAPPQLNLTPSSLSFPTTYVGASSDPQPVQVQNTGDLPATALQVTSPSAFPAVNSCGLAIPAHSSCQISVIFAPSNTSTTTGQLTIETASSGYTVPLAGDADPARIPQLNSASISQLKSGNPTTLHLLGANLDTVTSIIGGGVTYPVVPISSNDVQVTVTPPAWSSGSFTIVARSEQATSNTLSLSLLAAPVSYDTAVRFAQQATMAVTPDEINEIQSRGLAGWIDWQMSTPMFPYETRSDMVYGTYMSNTQVTQYALRQRMTLALKEIYTFGQSDQCFATECGHYWEARLQKDAFGNERDLLTDITYSPLMGNFLNNARNFMNYPFVGTHRANQNYARELMQLMTIGPNQLNHDGSTTLDASGNPIQNYSEDNISDMAAAMSGFYMTGLGQYAKVTDGDPLTPMSFWEIAHSPLAKDPLPGLHLQAGQAGEADTKAVLDALFNHPNIAPFLSRRFIQHFVTSNPSPAYVSRIADVFDNDGTGRRGNLGAVVKAILLDPEARRGDNPATAVDTDSHMLEPLLYISNVMSAVGGVYSDDRVYLVIDVMGQDLFMSPTVFGPYSPDNRIPTGEFAPEMQLVSNTGYMERISFVHSMVNGGLPGMPSSLTLSPFYNAPDSSSLLDAMRHMLFHGRMPLPLDTAMQSYVAANPGMSPNQLLPGLLQIALTSSSYQVVR